MEILIVIIFIWLIVLHFKVDDLRKKLEEPPLNKEENKIPLSAEETPPQNIVASEPAPAAGPAAQNANINNTDTDKENYLKQVLNISSNQPQENIKTAQSVNIAEEKPKEENPKQEKQTAPSFEFTAAKLFSWIGGFMLFLGCVFGIKYLVNRNILTPSVRIILSSGAGIILAVCGFLLKNPKYRITSHTLLGSGLAIVYAAIYCSHILYHFISVETAFILMAITSFAAMWTSIKKEAKYVGYLGAIIAFLTPALLNTGKDIWWVFFAYVFFINISSAYAAVKKNWTNLFICTLFFTWLCQAAWLAPFAAYKVDGIITFFLLYALASVWLIRKETSASILSAAVGTFLCMELVLMLAIAKDMAGLIISAEFFVYVLAINLILLFLVKKGNIKPVFANFSKILSFLILLLWFGTNAASVPLWFSLVSCVIFTLINCTTELPPSLEQNTNCKPELLSVLYPVGVMAMLFIVYVFSGWHNSLDSFLNIFLIMNFLLAVIIILTVLAEMLYLAACAVIIMFLLLVATIFGLEAAIFTPLAVIIGIIPLLLCGSMFYMLRRAGILKGDTFPEKSISFFNALMPFILILTVLSQFAGTINLNWLLGATFTVCVLNVLAARLYQNASNLPCAALGSALISLAVWDQFVANSNPHTALIFILWCAAIFLLFVAVPFISRKYFWQKSAVWLATALAGLAFYRIGYLVVDVFSQMLSSNIVPEILFFVYGFLLYLLWGQHKQPEGDKLSIGVMSGVCLFFLTVSIYLSISGYWLAVAWAVEAAFLAYINKILPYKAWNITSTGLGIVVGLWALTGFENLLPVPHVHIWNWYLWSYGICALCFGLIAHLAQSKQIKTIFYALCGLTMFWLMNIEIAQWFNTEDTLTFAFTGELAEALTYTLAWALYGSALIVFGLQFKKSAISKAGIGVMVLPLMKFIFSDIWQLELIYRILGCFALAVILMIVSFWYQRRKKIS